MLRFFRKLSRDETGATAVEYGLIVGLLSVVTISGMYVAGGRLQDVFVYIGNQLAEVSAQHQQ